MQSEAIQGENERSVLNHFRITGNFSEQTRKIVEDEEKSITENRETNAVAMRQPSILLLFFVVSHCILLTESRPSDIGSEMTITLAGPESALRLHPIQWKVPADKKSTVLPRHLIVPMRFRTYSKEGQLINIWGKNENEDIVFEMTANIVDSTVKIQFIDDTGEVTAHEDRLIVDANTGDEFSMAFELYPEEPGFGVKLSTSKQARLSLSRKIAIDRNLDVVISVGTSAAGKSSIVGCVTLLLPYLDGQMATGALVAGYRNNVRDGCNNFCHEKYCGQGQCVNNFVEGLCDCLGTTTYGHQCEHESKALNVRWDQHIEYSLDASTNRQPTRIALSFRVARKATEGVLLYAKLGSVKDSYMGELKLVLIESTLTLQLTDLISVVFRDFPVAIETFHRVLLNFNYQNNRLEIAVNEDLRHAEWSLPIADDKLRFENGTILFGGSPTNDIGMEGCLNELYVDYVSVIEQFKAKRENVRLNAGETSDCESTAATANLPPMIRVGGVGQFGSPQKPSKVDDAYILPKDAENEQVIAVVPGNINDRNEEKGGEKLPEDEIYHSPVDKTKNTNSEQQTQLQQDDETYETGENNQQQPQSNNQGDEQVNDGDKLPPQPPQSPGNINKTVESIFADMFIDKMFAEDGIGSGAGPRETECEQAVAIRCHNHGRCVIDHTDAMATPICRCNRQYIGSFCQFSALPRTCHEALALGNREPGVYELDLDGPGPILPTFAECRNGATIVAHNMPNDTIARSAQVHIDLKLPIVYKLFSVDHLRLLMKESETCEQFSQQQTWLESLKNPAIYQIGPKHEMCPCGTSANCQGGMKCNCDSNFETFDDGHLTGDMAGITAIYALMDNRNQNGYGRFTVGPLNCTGDSSSMKEISFASGDSHLVTEAWRSGTFEFEFRTSQNRSRLLSVGSPGESMLLELKEGHLMELHLSSSLNAAKTLQVLSQKRLNDTKWHRVRVEIENGELRLAVDSLNAFAIVANEIDALKNQPLIFGRSPEDFTLYGSDHGFIGCIRGLRTDKVVDLPALARAASGNSMVTVGCQSMCARNLCMHDAECVDDFASQSYQCLCKNPYIHLGDNCENNINDGTAVSFHNTKTGFLKFIRQNVLTETIVFSFRTDQSNALLLYAHDHRHNFIQVHLFEENKIALTLNNNDTVLQCLITATIGQEFSDMEWLQVVVLHTDEHVAMLVDDQMCVIAGKRNLATTIIDHFENDHLMTVYPPQLPVMFNEDTYSYSVLYVGGVPIYHQAEFRLAKRALASFYGTVLPPILGYMRGVRVGDERLDLQNVDIRPLDKDAIRSDWASGCERLECANGGHCTVQWNAGVDVEIDRRASCDCSKTSYFGSHCNEDEGLTFLGRSSLVFELAKFFPRFILPARRDPETLNFAFATRPHNNDGHRAQFLLVIELKDDRRFEVVLNRNGSLNAALIYGEDNEDIEIHTFVGNFTDGFRHFLMLTFNDPKGLSITLDSEKYRFTHFHSNVTLANAHRLYFGGDDSGAAATSSSASNDGGVPVPDLQKNSRFSPTFYQGCISNIDIDFHFDEQVHFRPIRYYRDTGSAYEEYTQTVPAYATLEQGQCASFRIPGTLPVPQRHVQFPLWESPFAPQKYERPPMNKQSGRGFPVWLIVLLVLLLAIIMFLLVMWCVTRRLRKKRSSDTNGATHIGTVRHDADYFKPQTRPYLYHDPSADVHETQPLTHTGQSWPSPTGAMPAGELNFDGVPSKLVLPQANRSLETDRPVTATSGYHPAETESVPKYRNSPPNTGAPLARISESSVGSSNTAYYTANEHLSSPSLSGSSDLDSTLKDYDEDATLMPEHGDLSERGFNRSAPQRLSSFRDPTAPQGSPLNRTPSDRSRRSPVYVPPPRSPIPRI